MIQGAKYHHFLYGTHYWLAHKLRNQGSDGDLLIGGLSFDFPEQVLADRRLQEAMDTMSY